VVDLVVSLEIAEELRDRSRRRRLAVVNVTNRADVHMRLVAFEFTLSHVTSLWRKDACDYRLRAINHCGSKTQAPSRSANANGTVMQGSPASSAVGNCGIGD